MYQVPYGTGSIQFSLPSGMRVAQAASKPAPPVEDEPAAVMEALASPLGTPPLHEMVRPGSRICIVFTDATRSCPDHLLIPPLLSELKAGGARDEDITLLCGIGMHRNSTQEEKTAKIGAGVLSRHRVIDNEPQNPASLVDLGKTAGGVPVVMHRAVVESDLVIATGIVEPHQYAGYSGGRKTVAIGAAGESLIACTHGPAFLDHAGTRLGRIEGNPFHEAITEAAYRAGLRFILNVVLDGHGRLLRVKAGAPDEAFGDLVAFARSVYEVPIPRQYDIAIAGVGFPKDSNLYQASRAPSFLFFAPTCVLKPGGFFIVPARCQEGAGSGVGERRFLAAMRDMPDIRAILDDARRNGYPPGQQRAFVMAKVLEQTRVIIAASECPDIVAACKMTPAATMDEAVRIASADLGPSADVLIVPHSLLTLPVVKE
jgi:nickel-dependent lactate racemase